MGEEAEDDDTRKAKLFELHLELKLEDGKHFKCRYPDCSGQFFGIDRINTHMLKTHGWTYPKLGVGKKLPSDIHDWKSICETWKAKLPKENNCRRPKSPTKISRGHGGKKVADFKVDWTLDRSVIKERAIEYAKFAVPDNDMGNPPSVRPIPMVCEIFTPQSMGEESFSAAFVEEIHRKLVSATPEEFESALSIFCESQSAEDATAVRVKASSNYFFLLLPPENRSWALSKAESVFNDVKEYVAELQAFKDWQEQQMCKQAKLERKRGQILAAKLLEYDSMQPGSDGKDLLARKLKLQAMLEDLTEQANLVRKEINELNGKEQVDDVDYAAVTKTIKWQDDATETIKGQATETIQGHVADNAAETIQVQATESIQGHVADNAAETVQVQATKTIQGHAATDDATKTVQLQVNAEKEVAKFRRSNKRKKVHFVEAAVAPAEKTPAEKTPAEKTPVVRRCKREKESAELIGVRLRKKR